MALLNVLATSGWDGHTAQGPVSLRIIVFFRFKAFSYRIKIFKFYLGIELFKFYLGIELKIHVYKMLS